MRGIPGSSLVFAALVRLDEAPSHPRTDDPAPPDPRLPGPERTCPLPHLFFYVFGIIFVAELPDKTALAALVLATRSKASPVFTGTALALAVQSAVAVLAGRLFSLLPARPVHIVAGLVFVVSAGVMFFKKEESIEELAAGEPPTKATPTFLRTATHAFVVVFLPSGKILPRSVRPRSPRGTQRRSSSSSHPRWPSARAAGVAIAVGNRAARFLDPAIVQKVAAVLFALVGLALVFNVV